MQEKLLRWETIAEGGSRHAAFAALHYKLIKWHPSHRSLTMGIWCFVQAHRHVLLEALDMIGDFEGNPDMEVRYQHLSRIHSFCEAIECLVAAMYNERLDEPGNELTEIVANALTATMGAPPSAQAGPEVEMPPSESVADSVVSELERLFRQSEDLSPGS